MGLMTILDFSLLLIGNVHNAPWDARLIRGAARSVPKNIAMSVVNVAKHVCRPPSGDALLVVSNIAYTTTRVVMLGM